MFLPLFQLFEPETNGFAAQTAGQQQHKKRAISLTLELFAIGGSPRACY